MSLASGLPETHQLRPSTPCRGTHQDGREWVVCQQVGEHVLGFAFPATQPLGSNDAEQGIARILARNYVTLLPILANRLRQVDQNSWRIDFPYSSDACRAASGNCKCKSTPSGKRALSTPTALMA